MPEGHEDDYQRKRQMQPVRGQSSQQSAKRSFQGPSKGPYPQGQQPQRTQGQQRPQGEQRPQQQGATAP
ncbi:hypothetical protein F511_35590 [Dorcoceras hygrometricum]|uniref:Uncharacterized protein n=1 Tax=Dorcoceras hygrometricum TaxID=472368 RepID=A0A2Z7AAX8_9LAMI|nr:hypothetical protein F511_35590 [Dorcoceras hygrometricum]